mmetsp:Transcript_15487/g.58685  ORF Transcript_15487/g.58685 Transcript_15487/m.58685 type:complete len:555 (+) Transcript_15487:216-1880(+)
MRRASASSGQGANVDRAAHLVLGGSQRPLHQSLVVSSGAEQTEGSVVAGRREGHARDVRAVSAELHGLPHVVLDAREPVKLHASEVVARRDDGLRRVHGHRVDVRAVRVRRPHALHVPVERAPDGVPVLVLHRLRAPRHVVARRHVVEEKLVRPGGGPGHAAVGAEVHAEHGGGGAAALALGREPRRRIQEVQDAVVRGNRHGGVVGAEGHVADPVLGGLDAGHLGQVGDAERDHGAVVPALAPRGGAAHPAATAHDERGAVVGEGRCAGHHPDLDRRGLLALRHGPQPHRVVVAGGGHGLAVGGDGEAPELVAVVGGGERGLLPGHAAVQRNGAHGAAAGAVRHAGEVGRHRCAAGALQLAALLGVGDGRNRCAKAARAGAAGEDANRPVLGRGGEHVSAVRAGPRRDGGDGTAVDLKGRHDAAPAGRDLVHAAGVRGDERAAVHAKGGGPEGLGLALSGHEDLGGRHQRGALGLAAAAGRSGGAGRRANGVHHCDALPHSEEPTAGRVQRDAVHGLPPGLRRCDGLGGLAPAVERDGVVVVLPRHGNHLAVS